MKSRIAVGAAALVLGGALAAKAQEKIVVDGSTTVGPIAKSFAEFYMKNHPSVNITVGESGSGNGAKSLLNGTCDIATMSRAMKPEERDAGAAKGIQVAEHVIAMDGIAVVVHPGNPVKGLTKQQVKEVYMGEIQNWKDVGGPDLKIVVIGRDTNSGTYESFQTLVMKSDNVTDRAEVCGSNGQIRQRVMTTPGAIGYVGLAFLENVKPLEVDGVLPTPETIKTKQYPVSRPLFMYTNGEPPSGTPKAEYLGLYKTDDGKKIINEQGFVALD